MTGARRSSARIAGAAAMLAGALAVPAHASGPLEYPDNGSQAFSRGGAWLATATNPLAAHYNPAGLARQRSAASLEMNMAFNKVCYDRRNPGNEFTGPSQGQADWSTLPPAGAVIYRPTCNNQSDFPRFVPSLGISLRLSEQLGVGFALVPPAAYGSTENEWPAMRSAYNTRTGQAVQAPASYRFMTTRQDSVVFFPTFAAGYEVIPGLSVGAGFISGFALIDVGSTGMSTVNVNDRGDHAIDDSSSNLKTQDWFMPGFVLSALYSPTSNIDLAAWVRWVDAIRTSSTDIEVVSPLYNTNLSDTSDICDERPRENDPDFNEMLIERCRGQGILNTFEGEKFENHFPLEIRVGIRFHQPREGAPLPPEGTLSSHDPLRDDVFDIELNGSFTKSSDSATTIIRQPERNGTGALTVFPTRSPLPPRGDREFDYKDTWGVRLGGQVNALPDKLGIMAGTWVETAAQEAEDLQVNPVAALRGGFGGGVVLRQDRFDFVAGYQRHWNAGLDNEGEGALRSAAGTVSGRPEPFNLNGPRGEDEFRSYHTVNGGRVVQSANVFTIGMYYRFF